jgi:hypothetical protein
MDCPARGQLGKGNISVYSQKERRFICRQCGKTFAERTGTPFYRLRTPSETVTLVVTLLAHGCPVQAIVAFRDHIATGWCGRQPLRVWGRLLIAPVVKRYANRRVVEVERRVVHGRAAQVEKARAASSGEGVINTAYIERLNGTFRERLARLARRTRGLARTVTRLEAGMWLVGTVYNFCTPHASLHEMVGKAVRDRLPAMAAGITRRRWSVRELLLYHVPPPQWTPPKKRGRRSRAMLALIEQWCQ